MIEKNSAFLRLGLPPNHPSISKLFYVLVLLIIETRKSWASPWFPRTRSHLPSTFLLLASHGFEATGHLLQLIRLV
jgi:hypothetical protein